MVGTNGSSNQTESEKVWHNYSNWMECKSPEQAAMCQQDGNRVTSVRRSELGNNPGIHNIVTNDSEDINLG
jgi:hypothetical protein